MKILAICGSTRSGSYNRRLLALAVTHAKKLGAEILVTDLKALDLPIYDGDIEVSVGRPPGAVALREAIASAHGLLLAAPEYNGSIAPVLSNAVAWASRPPAPNVFRGKKALLLGTGSQAGTARMQIQLRVMLGMLGVWVMGPSLQIAWAQKAFTTEGELVDEKHVTLLRSLVEEFVGALGP
jgi:chromate reductase, NAD(P)H dehydrogenase (quinone)